MAFPGYLELGIQDEGDYQSQLELAIIARYKATWLGMYQSREQFRNGGGAQGATGKLTYVRSS